MTEKENATDSESKSHGRIRQIRKIEERHNSLKPYMKINGKWKVFTLDTGSPVPKKPLDETIFKAKDIQKIRNRYQDVYKIEVKFKSQLAATI